MTTVATTEALSEPGEELPIKGAVAMMAVGVAALSEPVMPLPIKGAVAMMAVGVAGVLVGADESADVSADVVSGAGIADVGGGGAVVGSEGAVTTVTVVAAAAATSGSGLISVEVADGCAAAAVLPSTVMATVVGAAFNRPDTSKPCASRAYRRLSERFG